MVALTRCECNCTPHLVTVLRMQAIRRHKNACVFQLSDARCFPILSGMVAYNPTVCKSWMNALCRVSLLAHVCRGLIGGMYACLDVQLTYL